MQTKFPITDLSAHKGLRFPAKVISYLFHPMFMPVVMAIVISYLNKSEFVGTTPAERGNFLLNIVLNTIFFPLITTLLLKALGFIESIQLRTNKERIIPLIATMIFYFWNYWSLKHLNTPLSLKVLMLGAYWGVILVFMANIFIKVSMHTAAAGGAIGIVIVLMMIGNFNLLIPLLLTMLIGGIIGTARMVLQAHKPGEVWLGYLIGTLVQLGAYWYLK
ncbi:hypothetical protein F0919_10140 [Taibaiella lutea]|uniref:Phosphatase PAP2 family protein n=1 Tax=Taibaiella lutea TaxID=2608001 RepID=A0A5M6CP84_9BACT|nr:hypothetical protein [Taibaiella lutea]KAA5534949.1 hypothetical protein F0919_10140 [Taibaiella lutea]